MQLERLNLAVRGALVVIIGALLTGVGFLAAIAAEVPQTPKRLLSPFYTSVQNVSGVAWRATSEQTPEWVIVGLVVLLGTVWLACVWLLLRQTHPLKPADAS